MKILKPYNLKNLVYSVGVFLASGGLYYVVAQVGIQFAVIQKQASPIWPASGIAILLYSFLGPEAAAGQFIGNFLSDYGYRLSALPSLAVSFGNTMEAIACVLIYRRLMENNRFYGVHSKAIFALFSATTATAISATIGVLALFADKLIDQTSIFSNWTTWWTGDLIGALIFIPFAFKIFEDTSSSFNLVKRKYVLFFIFILTTGCLSYFVFFSVAGPAYLFILFIPLILAAIYLDSFWIFITSLFISFFSIAATFLGNGPFSGLVLGDNFIHLQLFLLGFGVTSIGLASLSRAGLHSRTIIALIFGWTLTGLTFYSFFNSNKYSDQKLFNLKAEQAEASLRAKVDDYVSLLNSGVGLFSTSSKITREEWRKFNELLLKKSGLSSVDSVGVALVSASSNSSKKELGKLSVKYFEPYYRVDHAAGSDFSKDENIYRAAIQARDSGAPAATEKIQLYSDSDKGSYFIMMAPFYKKGAIIQTLSQRQQAFSGVVYVPISIKRFVESSLGKYQSEIILNAFSGSHYVPAQVFFKSTVTGDTSKEKIVHHIKLAGQLLSLVWQKSSHFESAATVIFSLISFFGAILVLLLVLMLSSLQSLATTAGKIAEDKTKEVVEKNKIWKKLTETAPVGIFLTDESGKCTYVNPMWSKLTGLSLEQSLGDGWLEAIYEDDFSLMSQNWKQLKKTGRFNCKYRFIRPDQTIAHISGQAVPLQGLNNDITGYLGIVQDITELVERNMALIASSRLSSLGEMASGIAHEINNPLSIILGKSALLKILIEDNSFDREKATQFLMHISDTTHRIAKIIKGLRAFARDTDGVPFEANSLHDVINDTLELCSERFYNNHIELKLPDVAIDQLYFFGRSEQIAQVLLNLLNNAFDAAYSADHKWVEVKVKASQEKIQIIVIDSGVGINPQLIEKIFEPFYTSKEVGKGTGLGLSISKGIVENHLGRLFLDPLAQQTTFTIEIPRLNVSHEDPIKFIG